MKHVKILLLAAIAVLNITNLKAQEFDLHFYLWKPVNFQTTNLLVSWDGPSGTYAVLTNSDLNTVNWGTYDTVFKHDWLNLPLMSAYTIGGQPVFLRVQLTPDADQTDCPPTQALIITEPQDHSAYTNMPTSFDAYTIGAENRTHQWFFEGSAISGATNMVLKIANTQPSDEGEYYLVVSTPLSSPNLTSQVAYLTVLQEDFPFSIPSLPDPPAPGMSSSMGEISVEYLLWSQDPLYIIDPRTPRLRKELLQWLDK